ncbi:unnamed protein product, partial [Ixodes hexagonus]
TLQAANNFEALHRTGGVLDINRIKLYRVVYLVGSCLLVAVLVAGVLVGFLLGALNYSDFTSPMLRGTASNMGGTILITNTGLMWLCCCLFSALIAVCLPLSAILDVYGCDTFQRQDYTNLDYPLTSLRQNIGGVGTSVSWTAVMQGAKLLIISQDVAKLSGAVEDQKYDQLNGNVGNCKVAQQMSLSAFLVSCNLLAESMNGLWLSMLCCLLTMLVTMPVSFGISRYFFRVKRYLVDGQPPDEK